jgi:OmpA-OmpF porin, OOP family
MAINLVDSVKSYLTPEVIQKISSLVGESPSTTHHAMEGIVPALLSKMADVSSSDDGAKKLFNIINQSANGRLLGNLSEELSGGSATQKIMSSGRDILSTLFDSGLNASAESMGKSLGLRGSSVSSLLSMATPLILGVLGKERSAKGLSVTGLANLLTGQKNQLARLVPAGLTGPMGIRTPAMDAAFPSAAGQQRAREPRAVIREEGEKRPWWLWPALGLAALALLLYFFVRRPLIEDPNVNVTKLSLPDGSALELKPGSFGHNLAGYLGSGAAVASAKPVVLENLNFETGSITLTSGSRQTVNDLAAILKGYPSAQVRLDGYTDDIGEVEENKNLSKARADAIKKMLVQSGIEPRRVVTAGYGQEKPIASNDTEEGRAKNHRLELVVLKR